MFQLEMHLDSMKKPAMRIFWFPKQTDLQSIYLNYFSLFLFFSHINFKAAAIIIFRLWTNFWWKNKKAYFFPIIKSWLIYPSRTGPSYISGETVKSLALASMRLFTIRYNKLALKSTIANCLQTRINLVTCLICWLLFEFAPVKLAKVVTGIFG